MKLQLNAIRALVDAVIGGTPVDAIPHLHAPFRNYDFSVVTREFPGNAGNRLIDIKILNREDESYAGTKELIAEVFYMEGTHPGKLVEWPFKEMLFNRSFNREDLVKFGEFYVFPKNIKLDTEKVLAAPLWIPPSRRQPVGLAQASIFQQPGFQQMYQGPGSPYHQPGFFPNPGMPGYQPQFQQPFQPNMGQVNGTDTMRAHNDQRRKQIVAKWVNEHMQAEVRYIGKAINDVLGGAVSVTTCVSDSEDSDLMHQGLGFQCQVETELKPRDMPTLQNFFNEAVKDTGLRVVLVLNKPYIVITIFVI
uniref:Uncharacterized protein n=1 Tax=Pseudomonas phage RVTF4 TaxID=3236931 RepID=A0AB39CDG5_9VIRU